MKRLDPVQMWLDNVAYSHSESSCTEENYQIGLRQFCQFIGCTPQGIIADYEQLDDRKFRRKYSLLLRAYISKLTKEGYAVGSVTDKVSIVKSFFKYSDLALGYVPIAKKKVMYHNRDITKTEIVEILRISSPREKAFYSVMTQSGQRPVTLCNLRIKHIEPEFSKGIIPCKINIPEELAKGAFGAYFTFMGEESVRFLKAYFKTRGVLGPEDFVFASRGSDKPLSRKSISNLFTVALERLKAQGIIRFEQVPGKPRSVRLYCLRKYFRNKVQAGVEYVNFWMGHRADYKAPHIPKSDEHYFSREDTEFHRELYKEAAMRHLRLETATPSETEKTIEELRKEIEGLRQENLKLKKRLNGYVLSDSQVSELLRRIEKLEKQAKVNQ